VTACADATRQEIHALKRENGELKQLSVPFLLVFALIHGKRDELLFVSPMPAFASRLPFACR